MKIIDSLVLLVFIASALCCEADGRQFLIALTVAGISALFLFIRIYLIAKKEQRREYWNNRRAIFDAEQRLRRTHNW